MTAALGALSNTIWAFSITNVAEPVTVSAVGVVSVTIAPKTVKDPTITLFDENGDPLVSYTYDGNAKAPTALDGHVHGCYYMIVVVLISHDLVKDGVPPRFGGLGDGRSISSRRAVQRILDFAAAGLARLQKLMGLAIVGDDSRPR